MSRPVLYIPTRARATLVAKHIDKWVAAGDPEIYFVVDPAESEYGDYLDIAEQLPCADVITLARHNRGIGYIRQWILADANRRGVRHFVMVDDDYYPVRGKVTELLGALKKHRVIGCAAARTYHGITMGNEVFKLKADFPLPHPGFGCNVVAIDTKKAIKIGGYPEWADAWIEDHEIIRKSIAAGIPWWYSTRLIVAGGGRDAPGGHADYMGARRKKMEQKVHERAHREWPEFVSSPDKAYRTQWKKMLNRYCPGWELGIPAPVRKALK